MMSWMCVHDDVVDGVHDDVVDVYLMMLWMHAPDVWAINIVT